MGAGRGESEAEYNRRAKHNELEKWIIDSA